LGCREGHNGLTRLPEDGADRDTADQGKREEGEQTATRRHLGAWGRARPRLQPARAEGRGAPPGARVSKHGSNLRCTKPKKIASDGRSGGGDPPAGDAFGWTLGVTAYWPLIA
jgi:hypothetical protein